MSLCSQRCPASAVRPAAFHAPKYVVILPGQDQALDICGDRLATHFRRSVFKCPKPLSQSSLPAEERFRLNQRQSVLDIGRPVQDDQEQLVVDVEMDPLLPHFPCQDLVLFFWGSAFSVRTFVFDRKAWRMKRRRVASKAIMLTLKVQDGFQS